VGDSLNVHAHSLFTLRLKYKINPPVFYAELLGSVDGKGHSLLPPEQPLVTNPLRKAEFWLLQ
jgi:hypothetical protein